MKTFASDLKIIFSYWKTSVLSSISLKKTFVMQLLLMMISNFIFFSFWWIYFQNFPSVKGWVISDLALLYGIVSGSFGIVTVFFGGSRYIARIIFEGDLDSLLIRPSSAIVQILAIKSVASGWGDLAGAVILLALSGYCSLTTIWLIIPLMIFSTMIILAFAILLGSLAFWAGNSHQLSKQLFEFLLTFSNYPESIYSGSVRLLLYTLVPSAFIGFMPVNILRDFSIIDFSMVALFSVFYLILAIVVFQKGLKKYTSGNQMGFRI